MISAIVLTHNNGKSLSGTLDSLGFCDEIIVIDDNSDDDTRMVAGKYTSKIFKHDLDNNFAGQRNWGLSKAVSDWVLYVDSDEVVSPQLRQEILRTVEKGDGHEYAGFYLKRQDFIFGQQLKYGETADVRLLRLARRTAGSWQRPVHEVWMVKGQLGYLSNPLLHYPHPTIGEFVDDVNRYSTINAAYLVAQGRHIPAWQIVIYPTAKFFRNYLWKQGWRDGTAGMVMAIFMSLHSFLTRSKAYLTQNTKV